MAEVERNEKMRLRALNGMGATRAQNVNIWQTGVSVGYLVEMLQRQTSAARRKKVRV